MTWLLSFNPWCAGLLLALAAVASHAQPSVKQVLLLQSLDRGNLTLDRFTGNFRVSLDQLAGEPVNVVQVVVGPIGFVGAPDQAVVDYIGAIYAGRPAPDLVMTAGGPAAVFARNHSQQLFPGQPRLFAAVDQRYLRSAPLQDNEAAVPVANDFRGVIEQIVQVLPDTRHVFMVTGSGFLGRFWRGQLEPEFERYGSRLDLAWSDGLSLPEILGRVGRLPTDSAVFYLTFGNDAQGGAYADEQVLADLREASNAPLFSVNSPLMGHGIVGGRLLPIEELARSTADVANRILGGAAPSSFRPEPILPGQPVFDWRELQRWGIPESRLPQESEVRYRRPSLWAEYRVAILVSIGLLVLQSLLIALLLYERRARHLAQRESRRNLALAADANRRETMSALTASMGHELAQPLSAVRHNAAALQKMVAAGRAGHGETTDILADIQAGAVLAFEIFERHRAMLRGRQPQKKPIDIHTVIHDSLALVAHDIREREIDVSLSLSAGPCIVDGDQVLLQQVFLNLVRNAIDAVADMPPGRRQIAVRTAVAAEAIEVSVSDSGHGLPPEIVDTLFKPFVTTKSHGLGIGLTVTQSIVTAHGGAIAAAANAAGGATFTVRLPRLTAPAPL